MKGASLALPLAIGGAGVVACSKLNAGGLRGKEIIGCPERGLGTEAESERSSGGTEVTLSLGGERRGEGGTLLRSSRGTEDEGGGTDFARRSGEMEDVGGGSARWGREEGLRGGKMAWRGRLRSGWWRRAASLPGEDGLLRWPSCAVSIGALLSAAGAGDGGGKGAGGSDGGWGRSPGACLRAERACLRGEAARLKWNWSRVVCERVRFVAVAVAVAASGIVREEQRLGATRPPPLPEMANHDACGRVCPPRAPIARRVTRRVSPESPRASRHRPAQVPPPAADARPPSRAMTSASRAYMKRGRATGGSR